MNQYLVIIETLIFLEIGFLVFFVLRKWTGTPPKSKNLGIDDIIQKMESAKEMDMNEMAAAAFSPQKITVGNILEKKNKNSPKFEGDLIEEKGGYLDPVLPGSPAKEYEAYYPQHDPVRKMEGKEDSNFN